MTPNAHAGGHETIELVVAAILVVGGAIFIALSVRSRLARRDPAVLELAPADDGAPPTLRRSLAIILAGLSAGAAVIHLVAAPSHYAEIGDLAAGFVAAAFFQAAWIRWCLAGPSATAAAVGIVGNLAIVGAWAYTRTIGLPIGELAGQPEPIGYPDGASVVFELLLVAGLVAGRLGRNLRLVDVPAARTAAALAIVPVIGLVVLLTSLATVAVAGGLDHGAPTDHHAVVDDLATP